MKTIHYRGPWKLLEIACGEDITTVKSTIRKEKVTCPHCLAIMKKWERIERERTDSPAKEDERE